MKPLCVIAILFICGCQNTSSNKKNSLEKSAFSLSFNDGLTTTSQDTLLLQITRYKSPYSMFSDSSNSICKLIGDTLKLHLSTGRWEGSYSLDIQIVKDTFTTSFSLFDTHSKYIYSPTSMHIKLNKSNFHTDDYMVAQIDYNAVGKLQKEKGTTYDTVSFKGKIKLKVRDHKFTWKDFYAECNRNDFYALLNQSPDTIRTLNLHGCEFADLPNELSLFTSLEELDLTGNDLHKSDFGKLKTVKNLKSLNLTECSLSKFPLAILCLSNLEKLSIWNNKIDKLPEGLYNLTTLRELTIGSNNLKYLSPKISKLVNLESFESSSTHIRVYPEEMVKLKRLTEIYPNDTMLYIPKTLVKYAWGYDTILTK